MSWFDWDEMLHGEATGRSRNELFKWWEQRRVRFNFLVGIVGVTTWILVMTAGSAAVKPGVDFEEPLAMIFGPLVYAIMANICYTLGPIFDWIKGGGKPSRRMFAAGLFFSLTVTFIPGLWAVYCWIHSMVTGVKLD